MGVLARGLPPNHWLGWQESALRASRGAKSIYPTLHSVEHVDLLAVVAELVFGIGWALTGS